MLGPRGEFASWTYLRRETDIEHLGRIALVQQTQIEQLLKVLQQKCRELSVLTGSEQELQQTLSLIDGLTRQAQSAKDKTTLRRVSRTVRVSTPPSWHAFGRGTRMNDLSHHFHAQACNNAWSNLRLLRACAALDDAEFAAPRTGFFPSLKDTLNHIVTVDWLYVDALERAVAGRPVNPDAARFFEPPAPFATCATLAPAQREVDRRLIALCAGLTDLSPTVLIQRADHVQREPLVRVLAHLFQHQIHHRGQAHAMLAGTAVKPPQLDEFFLAEEAPLRAEELAALGLREADIWPGALSARAADGTEA